MRVANDQRFSYPGYNELFTGEPGVSPLGRGLRLVGCVPVHLQYRSQQAMSGGTISTSMRLGGPIRSFSNSGKRRNDFPALAGGPA